jgi:hypothetical protein
MTHVWPIDSDWMTETLTVLLTDGLVWLTDTLISSASGTERGEVFYGPTDWLGSHDPMTHIRYTHGSLFGLDD